MKYNAFLFDLNGTMIDDMQYHIKAWHRILNELGADISLERTKQECYGKNNELLERVFPGRFTENEKNTMGMEKEQQYQSEFRPNLRLIEGLDGFLATAAEAGIKMAIGSAAIPFNIDFVLDGLDLRKYFSVVISADDVINSKPDPETYLKCAAQLGVDPDSCLVFEDAPKGVEAAMNAGMDCSVLTTMHTAYEFSSYKNIIAFSQDFLSMRI
jgi:beta-phosphoglucomutase family hydrolase